MDAVKEYIAFRTLPRDLAVRIRNFYDYYYTRVPAFSEGGTNRNRTHAATASHPAPHVLGRSAWGRKGQVAMDLNGSGGQV